jgi:hypothetical protein
MLFLLWLVVGIYWQMRAQFRMRTGPLPWIGFVIYLMCVCGGFDWNFFKINLGFFMAYMIGILLFYLMLFMETWNGVLYRKIREFWHKEGLPGAFNLVPRWLFTYVIALCMGILFLLTNQKTVPTQLLFMVGTIACFALRDAGILHYFKLTPKSRRPESTTIFYLLLLYFLIPWLLTVLNMKSLLDLFWPIPQIGGNDNSMMSSLFFSFLQAVTAWALAWRRWRQYWQVVF